ncbi:MAG TPA: TfuA-like protein [Candidatus Xenobia bacterium]|jgi:hypothetical protein
MTVLCFLGPTLPVEEGRPHLDAIFLPPVSQGDLLAAVLQYRPVAVGIVDGYFDQVPAVWHKEILWAMAQGVHVFGSSSMGALRAAELHPFGMVGVGRIFEQFRDGLLEDDDEVAVVHAPAADGFRALSEAMVNIRAAIPEEPELIDWAKSLYYPDRTWGALEARAGRKLPRRNLKREDAVEMLAVMARFLASPPPPLTVNWEFHATLWWETLYRSKTSPPAD